MLQQRILLVFAVSFVLAASCFAQALDSTLPKSSNLAFGWVSMSGIDPTLDAPASFAPTMVGLREMGYGMAGEFATGTFTFGKLDVDSGWQSAQANLGPGVVRLVHYNFRSNTEQAAGVALPPTMPAGTPPLLVHTSGDSIELSYGQRVKNTYVGVSVIPQDSTDVSVLQGGATVAEGTSKAGYGARAGFVTPVRGSLRVGANYSWQKDSARLTPNPAHPLVVMTGVPATRGDYTTRCATAGFSGKPFARTTVYGSYQKIFANGDFMNRDAENIWFGVAQQLTKTVTVRANYLQKGFNAGFTVRTPIGLLIAAYTDKSLTNAKDVLGSGHALFVGIDLAK
jgi:hypothetical protein